MLFFYKLKSEDLPLKNQIKSKSHRSIDRSIVLFGGRRSEVIFLVFFGCIFGGRGEISSIIIAAVISISVSIEKDCSPSNLLLENRIASHRIAPTDLRVVFFFWTRRQEKFQL